MHWALGLSCSAGATYPWPQQDVHSILSPCEPLHTMSLPVTAKKDTYDETIEGPLLEPLVSSLDPSQRIITNYDSSEDSVQCSPVPTDNNISTELLTMWRRTLGT